MKTLVIILVLTRAVGNGHTYEEGDLVNEIQWHGGILSCLSQAELVETLDPGLKATCEVETAELLR